MTCDKYCSRTSYNSFRLERPTRSPKTDAASPQMTKTELENLIGQTVGDWKLVKFIKAGKSAAVFRGANSSQTAAVKIFDPALIEEFGRESQLKRILRELDLRGHAHPNLVQIFDG